MSDFRRRIYSCFYLYTRAQHQAVVKARTVYCDLDTFNLYSVVSYNRHSVPIHDYLELIYSIYNYGTRVKGIEYKIEETLSDVGDTVVLKVRKDVDLYKLDTHFYYANYELFHMIRNKQKQWEIEHISLLEPILCVNLGVEALEVAELPPPPEEKPPHDVPPPPNGNNVPPHHDDVPPPANDVPPPADDKTPPPSDVSPTPPVITPSGDQPPTTVTVDEKPDTTQKVQNVVQEKPSEQQPSADNKKANEEKPQDEKEEEQPQYGPFQIGTGLFATGDAMSAQATLRYGSLGMGVEGMTISGENNDFYIPNFTDSDGGSVTYSFRRSNALVFSGAYYFGKFLGGEDMSISVGVGFYHRNRYKEISSTLESVVGDGSTIDLLMKLRFQTPYWTLRRLSVAASASYYFGSGTQNLPAELLLRYRVSYRMSLQGHIGVQLPIESRQQYGLLTGGLGLLFHLN